jgi:PAS domain S-box-containing protein
MNPPDYKHSGRYYVNNFDVVTTNPHTPKQPRKALLLRWSSAGIRTKIIAPLVILMVLSLLGSTVGFIISTNTTRNRVLDGQLAEESQRVLGALQQQEQDAYNAAQVLAQDPELIEALHEDCTNGGEDAVMDMDSRAVIVRDRFRVDQLIVVNTDQQKRVNLAPSDLSEAFMITPAELTLCSSAPQKHLLTLKNRPLLVACAPVKLVVDNTPQNAIIGVVYTIQDIPRTLSRIKRELGILADIQIVNGPGEHLNHPAEQKTSVNGSRVQRLHLSMAGEEFGLLLLLSEAEINEIVGSGFQVMLISSGITLVLLLLIGYLLAQSFSRPILKLARVAQSVASGDLSQRANFSHQDEIGRLGTAFDHATSTITDLLDQRARKAGELQAILQSMADGVLAVDTNERIMMINPSAAYLMGQAPPALLGRPLYLIATHDDPVIVTGLEHIVEQVRKELSNSTCDLTDEKVSLGDRIVRLQSAPILGSGDTLTGAVVVIQDVTRAVEADRAKSAFIGTASHEMRTPLAAMKGFIDIFYMSGIDNLTESQRLFLDTIRRQTENLVQMVNDLLEMARMEQGTLRGEQRWISVDQTIEEILNSMRVQIDQRQLTLEPYIDPRRPQVWIDGLHIRRILTNLISNAVKYVQQGGSIWIRAYVLTDPAQLPSSPGEQPWNASERRSVVVEVEDNGVGIRACDQDRIFTRFFRSENVLSVEAGGSGLGLAITQSLVHLHNGQIGFRSVENEGSCFWVRLPAPGIEHEEQNEHDGEKSDQHHALRETSPQHPPYAHRN